MEDKLLTNSKDTQNTKQLSAVEWMTLRSTKQLKYDFAADFHRGSCCPVIYVSLCFMWLSCLLDFKFWFFLLFGCVVSLHFLLIY